MLNVKCKVTAHVGTGDLSDYVSLYIYDWYPASVLSKLGTSLSFGFVSVSPFAENDREIATFKTIATLTVPGSSLPPATVNDLVLKTSNSLMQSKKVDYCFAGKDISTGELLRTFAANAPSSKAEIKLEAIAGALAKPGVETTIAEVNATVQVPTIELEGFSLN